MTRGILIAGIESSLVAAVGAEAARRVERYAAALIPNRLAVPLGDRDRAGDGADRLSRSAAPGSLPGGEARPGGGTPGAAASPVDPVIPLEWNPGSPLSARTLVLAAENRLEHIDLAILVCTPPSLRRLPEQLAPADIEIAVNEYIKSWFFLVRELTAAFIARRDGGPAGILATVLADRSAGAEGGESPDMMGPSVAASFRSLAQGLLVSSAAKPWQCFAFSSDLAEDREFAAFIFKTIDEGGKRAAGKWHKYGKFPFFGR